MGTSCNGCRVLRKCCNENCTIRPCLQWIPTAQSQSNATLFLAKFYGRAGLINLINAGSQKLRSEIFKSLLYEACGRIVDPIHGSIGLMYSKKWHLCQAAVDAVLSGAPINQVSSQISALNCSPAKYACDIRHVSKDKNTDDGLRKVKPRGRFKRSASKPKPKVEKDVYESACIRGLSLRVDSGEGDVVSVETVEASLGDDSDLELELTLGFEPKPKKREQCQRL
ncbi:LOB domain-containing protein 40-like [Durio zibethinus]|uniref:LOB domain-containing protein 40-like n=1 Tax=Durio zibethinus TaxID=66656 RepID=A0A6P5YAI1_DURZI|nr:LOB domain-containing protein 40-like [Durio zibethinus]